MHRPHLGSLQARRWRLFVDEYIAVRVETGREDRCQARRSSLLPRREGGVATRPSPRSTGTADVENFSILLEKMKRHDNVHSQDFHISPGFSKNSAIVRSLSSKANRQPHQNIVTVPQKGGRGGSSSMEKVFTSTNNSSKEAKSHMLPSPLSWPSGPESLRSGWIHLDASYVRLDWERMMSYSHSPFFYSFLQYYCRLQSRQPGLDSDWKARLR